MKKNISIILLLSILFSILTPINIESSGFIKEIDANFDSIRIKIEDKYINTKEVFAYENEIWVPIKDLARGLNVGTKQSKDKKTIYLDSKGKLNKNIDSSKAVNSYQAGYEIDTKERKMEDLEKEIDEIERGWKYEKDAEPFKDAVVRNIKVESGDAYVYLDGKKLDIEPIIYKGEIYAPVNSLSRYLYITPYYNVKTKTLEIDGNGVLLNKKHYSNLDSLTTVRNNRNYLLGIQLAQLEKRKSIVKDLGVPYRKIKTIKDLENYLNKYLDNLEDIPTTIHIASSSSRNLIYTDISFSTSKMNKWYKLQRGDVEEWVWNIYTAILSLYDEDILVQGAIRNPYYSRYSNSSYKNYVTFGSKDNDLYFDFSNSRLKKNKKLEPTYLVERLDKNLNKYNKVKFGYNAEKSGDGIDLTAYSSSNDVHSWPLYTKMGYLKRLNWEIKRIYPDININGKLVFPDGDKEPMRFFIGDNRILSSDLLRETEEYLNKYYGSFTYSGHSFGLKYSLYEKGKDDLKMVVEGDFSVDDDRWIKGSKGGEQRLNSMVQNAISYCISLWNMNVFTEVLDKNLATITEVDIYQDNVGIVYANPSSGEVKEGTKVYLYTDTHDAKIYYTIDGSTPTTQSTLYGEPIVISRDMTINAFGYKEGLGAGPISTFEYTVVPDDGWSYGLTDLKVDKGTLTPAFARDILDYEVYVDRGIENISITPSAKEGTIKIDGQVVESERSKNIALAEGKNIITISVKEKDKKERTYAVVVYRGTSGEPMIQIKDLQFNTILVGTFKGKLVSDTIRNFSGYEIKLCSKAGKIYETTNVNSDGTFEITGFDVDPITKALGYKYKVYDGGGKLVLENELP